MVRYLAVLMVAIALLSCSNRGDSSKRNEERKGKGEIEATQLKDFTSLNCSNGYTIEYKSVGSDEMLLVVEKGAEIVTHKMKITRSGSGAKYQTSDGKYVFWSHHGDFSYFVGDKRICSYVKPVKKSKLSSGNLYTVEYKTGDRVEIIEDNSFSASISLLALKFDDSLSTDTLKLETDPVVDVLLNDIDRDGTEELLLVTTSTGSGSYGSVYGFVLTDSKVLQCNLPEITKDQLSNGSLFEGYMGHDRFYIEGDKLVREFPIYKEGDSNAQPTGGKKKIRYTLRNNSFEIMK